MDRQNEDDMRAMDALCRLPTSPASRTTVIKVRALAPASQALCLMNFVLCDLPHLVRCSLEAGVSADTRCDEDDLTARARSGAETDSTGRCLCLRGGFWEGRPKP